MKTELTVSLIVNGNLGTEKITDTKGALATILSFEPINPELFGKGSGRSSNQVQLSPRHLDPSRKHFL